MVHIHNGILHRREKEGIPISMTTWMEMETSMLSEISQLVKDKYHVILLIRKI